MLVSEVQQCESAISKHIFLSSWASFPPPPPSYASRSSQSMELPGLWSCPPIRCFTHGSVYMCQCCSVRSTLFPLVCPKVCSLLLHLYSCHQIGFICTIFLDSIYIYMFDFFLSDLHHSVWQTLSPSTSLQMTQLFSTHSSILMFCFCFAVGQTKTTNIAQAIFKRTNTQKIILKWKVCWYLLLI